MEQIPKPLPLSDIMEQYPVKYEESMNTVLVQEVRMHACTCSLHVATYMCAIEDIALSYLLLVTGYSV